jgi:hypothetical protein
MEDVKMTPELTDEQVAGMVRMLGRSDLDHEMVCVAARDRIMALSAELEKLKAPMEIAFLNGSKRHDCPKCIVTLAYKGPGMNYCQNCGVKLKWI